MKTKKIILIVVLVLAIMSIVGLLIIKSNSNWTIPEFANIDWVSNYDDDEPQHIWFGKDGHFSYYWASGSPVRSYDLCESYKYNEEEGFLKIKCDSYDDVDNTIRVVKYDGKILKLEIFDETIEFKIQK